MKNDINIVALIPARGGSKGIPGKNLKLLGGKPLIAHAIEAAKRSAHIREVYVSTDSAEIAAVARRYGALVVDRPTNLATDMASSELALLHFSEQVSFDVLVFLQCTTPFTATEDIDSAIVKFLGGDFDTVFSVCVNHGGFLCGGFLWNERGESVNFDYQNRERRQDREKTFLENGAIYIMTKQGLLGAKNRLHGKIGFSIMSNVRSFEIDDPSDFELAERIIAHPKLFEN